MNWWPWTWFLCHSDDVEFGTPCTWISPEERRPGRIEVVTRSSQDGLITSVKAREFVANSTRYFSIWHNTIYDEPDKPTYPRPTAYGPSSGRFSLLVGYAEPPFNKDDCRHPQDMRKEFQWEWDNGYGTQKKLPGHICRICGLQNNWPGTSNNWYSPDDWR